VCKHHVMKEHTETGGKPTLTLDPVIKWWVVSFTFQLPLPLSLTATPAEGLHGMVLKHRKNF